MMRNHSPATKCPPETDRNRVGTKQPLYRLTQTQQLVSENEVMMYGIESTEHATGRPIVRECISTDRAPVENAVRLLNEHQVSYVHFYDVLEDMELLDPNPCRV